MKRILCFILSLGLLITACADFNIAAANEPELQRSKSVRFLEALGIINVNDNATLTEKVTREDFAVYVAKLLNIDTNTKPSDRCFRDLSMTSYGAFAVNTLVDLGVLSVSDDKKFRPDDNIITAEAAKMLCVITGYKDYAEATGGYPNKYIEIAKRNDMILNASANAEITLSDAAEMLYNTAMLNIYDIKSISADGQVNYTNKSEKTILSVYHNIYFDEGTVSGVYGKSIYDREIPKEDEIYIDDTLFKMESLDNTDDYLGEYVKYFYRYIKSESVSTVVFIERRAKKAAEKFEVNDFISFDKNTIEFYSGKNNDKKKQINLSNPIIVYNGYPISTGIEDTFNKLNKGYISVKDMDDDGTYDLIIIDDRHTMVISYADSKNQEVYSKTDELKSLECRDFSVIRIYNEEYAPITFDDIQENDVLSVEYSKNKESITIICTRNMFNGTLNEVRGTDDVYAKIGEEEYKVDKNYVKDFTDIAHTGNKYYYALDDMDEIVYVSADSGSRMNFGYVIKMAYIDEFVPIICVKMITEAAKIEEFEFADRIRIDGTIYREVPEKAKSAFVTYTGGEFKEVMIRYDLDSDGKICKIDTPYLNSQYENEYNSLTPIFDTDFSSQYSRGGRLGLKAYTDSRTVVFNKPEVSVYGELRDEDVFIDKGLGNDSSLTCNAYTVNINNEFCDTVICNYEYSSLSYNNLNSKLLMVKDLYDCIGEDGSQTKGLSGYLNGTYVEYVLKPEITPGDIEKGDIVKLHFNDACEPIPSYDSTEDDIVKIYDYSLWKGKRPDASTGVWNGIVNGGACYLNKGSIQNYYARLQLSFGYAHKRRGMMLEMGYNSGADFDEIFKTSAVKVVVYDKNERLENQVYIGSISDILDYESIGDNASGCLVQTRDMDAMCLYVYR